MAAQIPINEPDRLMAGNTAKWIRSVPDYPASDGWALSYALVQKSGTGGQAVTFSATASGDDFLVNVPGNTTAQWPAGEYAVQGYVSKAGDRFCVFEGTLTVAPNFAAGQAGDVRSHARKVLDAIEAVLEKRATQEILEWTIEGTQLRKAAVNDLLALRDRYKTIVLKEEARERARQGRPNRRRILTQFVRPGFQGTWPPGFIRS
jgi:hypothetical protein